MEEVEKLTESQIDALKEVSTIGSGHAVTALSQLIDKKIMITVPVVRVIPLKMVPEILGDPEALVAATHLRILGDASGHILLLFPRSSALALVDLLLKQPIGSTKVLSEMGESALKEVGNILAGAYLGALTEFLGILMLHSVPSLAFDMIGAILDSIAIEWQQESNYAFCIETEFIETTTSRVKGYFLLIPDLTSLRLILRAISMKIKR